MAVAHLHELLINALVPRMAGWRFVARERHFKRQAQPGIFWFVHLSFINHAEDFDVVTDVAVTFVCSKKTVCVIGAQPGNIAGEGQTRFKIRGPGDIAAAVAGIVAEFQAVGLPFLERFSRPAEALAVLKQGGREAALISPLIARHEGQMRALEELIRDGTAGRADP